MRKRMEKRVKSDFEDFCKYELGSDLIIQLPKEIEALFRNYKDIQVIVSIDKKQCCFYGLDRMNINDENYKIWKSRENIIRFRNCSKRIKEIRKRRRKLK